MSSPHLSKVTTCPSCKMLWKSCLLVKCLSWNKAYRKKNYQNLNCGFCNRKHWFFHQQTSQYLLQRWRFNDLHMIKRSLEKEFFIFKRKTKQWTHIRSELITLPLGLHCLVPSKASPYLNFGKLSESVLNSV